MLRPEYHAQRGIGGDWHVVTREEDGTLHSVEQHLTPEQAKELAAELNEGAEVSA